MLNKIGPGSNLAFWGSKRYTPHNKHNFFGTSSALGAEGALFGAARAYLSWELAEILRANRQSGLNFNALCDAR